jgi:hypothetical protein
MRVIADLVRTFEHGFLVDSTLWFLGYVNAMRDVNDLQRDSLSRIPVI